ncbi:MAG: acylphosphatase [Thermoanaerobaculia bacterium]
MRKYRITGRVQGVGFRFYTRQRARDLGLKGWVRNCPDGSVEALATGSEGQLEAFEAALRRGPAGSQVNAVESAAAADAEAGDSFEIVYRDWS